MKKIFALILAALFIFSLAACGNSSSDAPDASDTLKPDTEENVDYDTKFNITVISGTTGMGFAKMMHDASEKASLFPYDFELASAADIAASAIIGGSADIAAVPSNLAATLAKKTAGEVQIVAANTLGVLYLIENGNTVTNVSGLRGKTVYCCQRGANPEYITTHILSENGLDIGKDVTLDFSYNTPDELMTAIASGTVDLAVLPEPKVTAATSQNENLRIAIDFTEEWQKINEGASLVQGCIIATKSFIDAHPAELEAFLSDYKASVDFTNGKPDVAAEYMAELGIIPKAPLALRAIPSCNICFITGDEMQSSIMSFYEALYSLSPASVGGEMPNAETLFYKSK